MDPDQKTKRLRTEQKPVALMKMLLNVYCSMDEWTILDLCCGTSPLGEAVMENQDGSWVYWGIDEVGRVEEL